MPKILTLPWVVLTEELVLRKGSVTDKTKLGAPCLLGLHRITTDNLKTPRSTDNHREGLETITY